MTGLQHVYLAYGIALLLLGGYSVLLWTSLYRVQREQRGSGPRDKPHAP